MVVGTQGEVAQEVEVLGTKVGAVFFQVLEFFFRDADVGELLHLLLKPVVGFAIKLEILCAVGESVCHLYAGHQHSHSASNCRGARTNILEVLEDGALHSEFVEIRVKQ